MLRIDHVLVGAREIDSTAHVLGEKYGLGSFEGPAPPNFGTTHHYIQLGGVSEINPLGQYVELVAVAPDAKIDDMAFGNALPALLADGDRPLAWAVATDDLDNVASRLGLVPWRAFAVASNGTRLSWRMAGFAQSVGDPFLPFFISYERIHLMFRGPPPVPHTSTPEGIAWVAVSGDERRLSEWLGDEDLPVRVTDGPPGLRAVGIATAEGEITLRWP